MDWKSRLNNHQPDESVWNKIEKELDFESGLANHLKHLPAYKPDSEVWNRISGQLPKNKSIKLNIRITAIAASVAVILTVSTLFLLINTGKSGSEQQLVNNTLTEDDMEQEAMTEIKNQCNLHMPVCEQNNFRELMQLYDELKTEEMELKTAIQQLGDSPEMIQALVKIENMKSETIQDLIILIQS